ncbi:MAG TPA: lipid-A-disaccharide synthase, partial [bacterium]|nr:lipid-A-disaccharide synthase [bacterium]
VSWLNYIIAKALVKLKYAGLPNILLNRGLVRELIQGEMTPENMAEEMLKIHFDAVYRKKMIAGFKVIQKMLYKKSAADKIAEAVAAL